MAYQGRGNGRGYGRERSVLHTGHGNGGGGFGGRRGGYGGGGGGGRGGSNAGSSSGGGSYRGDFRSMLAAMRAQQREADQAFDSRSGFERYEEGPARIGYLFNMLPATLVGEDRLERSALDLFFLQQDGDTFKATVAYEPYFYLCMAGSSSEREIVSVLERRFEGRLSSVSVVEREDLEMPNHLAGHKRRLIMLSFRSVNDLTSVRNQLKPVMDKNAAILARGDSLEVSRRQWGNGASTRVDPAAHAPPPLQTGSLTLPSTPPPTRSLSLA